MDYTKKQIAVNEAIRHAYGFLKYTEGIREHAPWAYETARTNWLEKISEGYKFMNDIASCDVDPTSFSARLVTQSTEMKQRLYTVICAQGPCEREEWMFPWESEYKTSYR